MYLTFSFIIQILAACWLLYIVSSIRVHNTASVLQYKFFPLILVTCLMLNAFNIVK